MKQTTKEIDIEELLIDAVESLADDIDHYIAETEEWGLNKCGFAYRYRTDIIGQVTIWLQVKLRSKDHTWAVVAYSIDCGPYQRLKTPITMEDLNQ